MRNCPNQSDFDNSKVKRQSVSTKQNTSAGTSIRIRKRKRKRKRKRTQPPPPPRQVNGQSEYPSIYKHNLALPMLRSFPFFERYTFSSTQTNTFVLRMVLKKIYT